MPTRRTCFAALRSRRCGPLCRSDDNAAVKPKMLYASSKDALKKALTGARRAPPGPPPPPMSPTCTPHPRSPGINEEYQATDRGDLDHAEIKKKAGSV